MKSIFLFIFGLIASWGVLGLITGEYSMKNLLVLSIAYLGVSIAARQKKE